MLPPPMAPSKAPIARETNIATSVTSLAVMPTAARWRTPQSLARCFHSAPGERIGPWRSATRNIGFQQLGKRIHAVGGNHVGRTGCQQIGVDHRNLGDQFVVPKRFLEPVQTLRVQHSVFGDFRACTRRRRHRNTRVWPARYKADQDRHPRDDPSPNCLASADRPLPWPHPARSRRRYQ